MSAEGVAEGTPSCFGASLYLSSCSWLVISSTCQPAERALYVAHQVDI